jgi:hypothetical protein|tara:strand:- start:1186 stop:1365 length:180 start_codon:yes stop_codon:yes gene_type:complete
MKIRFIIITFISLIACNSDEKSLGPAHNYEVPDNHVITEMDGDREINWYSEDEGQVNPD